MKRAWAISRKWSSRNSNQLQNYSPPLQDPLNKICVDEVMLHVVHHTPQQLKEVLPRKMTKGKSLHEISTVAVDCLQTCDALLRYTKAMEINIRRSNTPKVCWVKIIGLSLLKTVEEGSGLSHRIGTVAKLLPISN